MNFKLLLSLGLTPLFGDCRDYMPPQLKKQQQQKKPARQQQLHAYERRVKTKTVQLFSPSVSKYAALQSGRD